MLSEISTPVTTNGTCVNEVRPEGEVGRDNGKNFLREAVDGDERVPPLADVCQRDRSVLIELRDHIEGEPVSKWLSLHDQAIGTIARLTKGGIVRLSSSFRAKMSCESERPWPG